MQSRCTEPKEKPQEQPKEQQKSHTKEGQSTDMETESQFSPVSSDEYEKYEDLAKLMPLTDSDEDDQDQEIDPNQNH